MNKNIKGRQGEINNIARLRKIEKPWGYELIFTEGTKYTGKVIVVNEGERLSLHYHNNKEETLFLRRGIAKVSLQGRTVTLRPGDRIHLLPKVKHRIEALEECEFFEASTPELSQSVRLEDDYGRAQPPSFAVIMAGGEGMRLWPLSRRSRSKHLLNLTGNASLIQETVKRIRGTFCLHDIFVVTQCDQFDRLKAEITDISRANFILEPMARNTAPCAGLAAIKLEQICPEGIMVLLPADHLIEGEENFLESLATAVQVARADNQLVLLGIKPKRGDTGYGYIHLGRPYKKSKGLSALSIKGFIEKPDSEQAEHLFKAGCYLWNSGIVVAKVSTLLEAIKAHLPDLHAGLRKIKRVLNGGNEESVSEKVYKDLKATSLDYGILEKARNVLVIPCDFAWSDLGSWTAVAEVHRSGVSGQQVVRDVEDCFIWSPNKLVAALGVKGLIVVETEDCLLICSKDRCQEVKVLVQELEKRGLREFI